MQSQSQSVSINIASLPQDYPSICIPRTFKNITWKQVKTTVEELGLGRVQRVDMVPKTNDKGDEFQRVFIHMSFWDRSEEAQMVRQKLLSGESIKIVYNDPWYWQLSMSRVAKPTFQKKTVQHSGEKTAKAKPRIVINSSGSTYQQRQHPQRHSHPYTHQHQHQTPVWTTPSQPPLPPTPHSRPTTPPSPPMSPPLPPSIEPSDSTTNTQVTSTQKIRLPKKIIRRAKKQQSTSPPSQPVSEPVSSPSS